jgi:hypothetical protein
MRFSHIREISPNGDFCDYHSYTSYRAKKLETTDNLSGFDAKIQLLLQFSENETIERKLETDFNLIRGGAEGLLLIFRNEGEARSALLDPAVIQACNHPRSTVVLTTCSAWRFNYCRIYHPSSIITFFRASQPHSFAAARG